MSVLRNLEEKLAGLVEGTFGRVFRTQVRPVEIARKLAREMDEHKTVSVSRTYVPNEYAVWLSPDDRERFEGVEHEVIDELSAYLLEHARRERLALISRPQIEFRTDERLQLGEFGIQARMVRTDAEQDDAEQGDHGKTMVYSTSSRVQPVPRWLSTAMPRRWPISRAARMTSPDSSPVSTPISSSIVTRSSIGTPLTRSARFSWKTVSASGLTVSSLSTVAYSAASCS